MVILLLFSLVWIFSIIGIIYFLRYYHFYLILFIISDLLDQIPQTSLVIRRKKFNWLISNSI